MGAMKRLYIGGLSHTITQKDLKDRFGKFGDVEDVELRTRRDDEGVPYKTFSYININISDGDLKKCMTVLNKSKWKGGTLQIEAAKESFLHRLAEEREETAAEQQQPAGEDKTQKMLDSLSKAGVDNFTMKAAVPGTEVPGHKDWVVSKFGRVLPVLQIRCRKGSRARTMKYDPSKYSHNIHKLDRSAEDPPLTPVTQLTWEVQGGDDDISKKRRGEFSPYEPPRRKKSRADAVSSQSAEGGARFKQTVDSVDHTAAHRFANGNEPPTNHRPAQGKGPRSTDWDLESDEEIRKPVAVQSISHAALQPEEKEEEEEEDTLEVVGLDYLVKSGRKGGPDAEDENDYDSADTDELFASRKPPLPPAQERPTPPATALLSGNDGDRKRKMKKKSHEEEDESSDAEEEAASRKPPGKQSTRNQSKKMKVLPVVKLPSSDSDEEDEDEDEEEEESELADCSSDSDYEAMFSNVTRLEISLADLQMLAEESQQTSEQETLLTAGSAERPAPKKGTTPEEILAALMEDSSEDEQQHQKKKTTKKKTKAGKVSTPLPAFQGMRALNEGSETEERRRPKGGEEGRGGSEVRKQKLDPKATGRKINGRKVTESESSEEEDEEEEEEKEKEAGKVVKNMAETASSSSSDEEEEAGKVVKNMAETASSSSSDEEEEAVKVVKNMAETASSSSSEEEEEEERFKANQTVLTAKAAAAASSSSSSSSAEEDEQENAPHSESSSSDEEEEEKQAPPRVPLGAKEEEARQRKANVRRLAAVQQRQKEAEEHKKLIQGALANLDDPKAGAGKHIVFGSDEEEGDEEEDEDEQRTTSAVTKSKVTLFQNGHSEDEAAAVGENETAKEEKVRRKPPVPQLFGGSEDEDEEDGDEEEDGSRFDIRPQFEGRGGQKLMELQSRFGTDERFRMDSRFLEEDEDKGEESENKKSVTEEEEALEEERKKNLSILQSVLGDGQQTCSGKTPAKAKTFRDVSALHYDPSKEEHAAFETKTDEAKKESKAARRKKREEAQKLPEVSKEIYYDVSGDLKAVFGPTKEDDVVVANVVIAAGGDEEANWDQEDEEEDEEEEEEEEAGKDEQPSLQSILLSADPGPESEEASGFKFSFFEDEAETGSGETAEYKVESIQAPKVSWQQDLRFQDSSSDEEEEEKAVEEEEEQSNVTTGTTEEETPSKTDRFFFFLGDSRLTEGPRSFCRPAHLEEQREQWEERRNELREEYRKKHKDARRKLRSSLKS